MLGENYQDIGYKKAQEWAEEFNLNLKKNLG